VAKTTPKNHDEKYISGEEFQALRQSETTQSRQVTIQTLWLGWAAVAVVLLAVGFWSGLIYQKHHTKTVASNSVSASSNGLAGRGGFGGGRRLGGFGQVTAVSPTSITITNQRTGASTTYAITSGTAITDNGQAVTTTDIQTGDTVIITNASSSSTTATRILVNPSFGGGFGGTSAPVSPNNSSGSLTN
jgi:hypothetical protein